MDLKKYNIGVYFNNDDNDEYNYKQILQLINPIVIINDLITNNFISKLDLIILFNKNLKILEISKKYKIKIISTYDDDECIYIPNYNILNIINAIFSIKDKISIIIPSYNCEKYINDTIQSALSQTYDNYEIIIVDDASIDNTLKIINNFKDNNKIKIIKKIYNQGKFINVNDVLKNLNTDYFMILDSDDKIISNRLLYDLIYFKLNNKLLAVQSKYIRYDDNTKENIHESKYGENIITYKYEIIKKIGFYNENRFGGDTEYIMRLVKFIGLEYLFQYDITTYISILRADRQNLTVLYNKAKRIEFIKKINLSHKNNDINYFLNIEKIKKKEKIDFNLEFYKKCYLDLEELDNKKIIEHWENYGNQERRIYNYDLFLKKFPNFNLSLFIKNNNNNIKFKNKYHYIGWIYLKKKSNYYIWLDQKGYVQQYIENENKLNKNIVIDLHDFIKEKNIKFLNVSDSLTHFKRQFRQKYGLKMYNPKSDSFDDTLFFGMYREDDYYNICNHSGTKYLIWGGTDVSDSLKIRNKIINRIKYYIDIHHCSISSNIYDRLNKYEINSTMVYLNMVNTNIFIPTSNIGTKIYIYNGFTKGNEKLYGDSIYKKVIEHLPDFNYIFSNELNLSYEKMPLIYSECFIGLRLTSNDGNANTVQEFNAMNIPIVYNGDGGIHWTDDNSIVKTILFYHNNLNDRINKINLDNEINNKKLDISKLDKELNDKKLDISNLDKELNDKKLDIVKLDKELNDKKLDIVKLDKELNINITEFDRELNDKKLDIVKLDKELNDKKLDIVKLDKEIIELTLIKSNLENDIKQKQNSKLDEKNKHDNTINIVLKKKIITIANREIKLSKLQNILIIIEYKKEQLEIWYQTINFLKKINIECNFLLINDKNIFINEFKENIKILDITKKIYIDDYKKLYLENKNTYDTIIVNKNYDNLKNLLSIYRNINNTESCLNNILKYLDREIIIFINYEPINDAYGGGNQFSCNLINYLKTFNNVKIVFNLIENIDVYFIIDIRKGKFKKYTFDEILNNRNKNNKGKIIYRINDCDITRETKSLEEMISKYIKDIDIFVFNSDFIKKYYFDKYKEFMNKDYEIIYNTVNENYFFPKIISNNNIKIKIVTHHWSDNINKGYDYYYQLFEYCKTREDIEFVFIGRVFNNKYTGVSVKGPYKDMELGEQLRDCDIYITASVYDACPMHVLEGLACGLPILYINEEGGGKNICEFNNKIVGEKFNNFNELKEKINIIKNNINFYKNNIIQNIKLYNSKLCYENFSKIIFSSL